MTTVVESLNRIARACSVKAPSSWVTATRDDQVELREDFLSETVQDVLERVDLPSPIGASVNLSTLSSSTNADGSRTFTLPTDFLREHRDDLAVYDSLQDRPCVPVPSDGVFEFIADTGTAGVVHYFQVRGYEGAFTITLYDDPGSTADIVLKYNTDNWLINGGTAGSDFTAEDDVLLLPRRVVEAGTTWRFRERHGLDFLNKYNEYEALIARMSNDRRSRRIVSMGEPEHVRWQDLVPAFIPSS